jgi:hypothetical protein
MNSGDLFGAAFLIITAVIITWWALTAKEK